jgi:hypothetical protein
MPTLNEQQRKVQLMLDTGAVLGRSKNFIVERQGNGKVILRGELGRADAATSNNRVYPKEVIEREVDRLQKEAKLNRLFGELDHPCLLFSKFSVLTLDGWKPFREVKIGEKVWSRKNGKAVVSVVEGIVNEPYDGPAYQVKGRGIDSGFTPGHRILSVKRSDYKVNSEEQYHTVEDVSANLISLRHNRIPKCAEWEADYISEVTIPGVKIDAKVQHFEHAVEQDLKLDAQLFAAFMGIYLSEGNCTSDKGENYGIFISQKNNWSRQLIWDQILSLFPEDLKWHQEKNGFYLSDARLYQYLKPLGDAYHKYVPSEVKNLNAACLKEFIFWFGIGDGRMSSATTESKDNWNVSDEGWRDSGRTFKESFATALRERTLPFTRREVFSVSKRLITDLHECLVKSGGCGTLSEIVTEEDYEFAGHIIKAENKKPLYQLHISQSDGIYLDPRFLKIEKTHHKGNIYCLSVTHGNFYMEQSGHSFWTGNSDGRTQFQRVSHILRDIHLDENGAVIGEIEILDTARGKDLKAIIGAGGSVGVSSRGTGTTHKRDDGADVVNDDYTLITYDVVADPAHSGAYPDVFFEWNEAKNLGRVEEMADPVNPAGAVPSVAAVPPADAPQSQPEPSAQDPVAQITVTECEAKTQQAVADAIAKIRDTVQAEEREKLKEELQAQLLQQVESVKKEAMEQARSEILSDPKVADAKRRVDAIRSILGSADESMVTKEEHDKVLATLKEKDEILSKLTSQVEELTQKFGVSETEKKALAETSRRAFIKNYVEKRIAELPDKDIVREFIMKSLSEEDDAKAVEKKVTEVVAKFQKATEEKQAKLKAISEQIRAEVAKETGEMNSKISALAEENTRLKEQNTKLRDLSQKGGQIAKSSYLQAYLESKISERPDRVQIRKMCESMSFASATEIDKYLATASTGKDSELLTKVRASVAKGIPRVTTATGQEPKSILSEGREPAQKLYGYDLSEMKKLAGVR